MRQATLNGWAKLARVVLVPCLAIGFLSISLITFTKEGSLFGSLPLHAQSNPIVTENQNTGTTNWQITSLANDIDLQIKGFASATSVDLGGSIDFYVTVSSTTSLSYTITLYRMGWYQGTGGREIMQIGPLTGITQPPPIIDPVTGLIETNNWTQPHTLIINPSWTSGVYLAKLENADGRQNYIKFVVRDSTRNADFLYHHADTTDQAYNAYPRDNATGKNLYKGWGGPTISGQERAVKVSFDRPYDKDGSGQFFRWEYPLVRWLEKEGYDITYASDLDTHQTGTGVNNYLRDYKAVLSAGHDEYFSKEMFDAFEDARDQGVHLAFFGSNAVYWQSRFEDNDRTMVVYKDSGIDPEADPALKSIRFRSLTPARPEQTLIGVQYATFNDIDDADYTDYIVDHSEHWVYSFSGFEDGDAVTKLTGYEVDNDFGHSPPVITGTHTFLASSPFTGKSTSVTAQSSIYQATSGAWVFASGTMNWSLGLADGSTASNLSLIDPGIQVATSNILDTFLSGTPPGSCVGMPGGGGGSATLPSGTSLFQEAELGNGSGDFERGFDAAASGGAYIHAPAGSSGGYSGPQPPNQVDFCFSVNQAGIYRIPVRAFAFNDVKDSFWFKVNDVPANGYRWDVNTQPYGAYHDDYIELSGTSQPYTMTLPAGEHTISLFVREPETRLDKIGLELVLAAPTEVTLLSPNGSGISESPTFQWIGNPVAESYDLIVYNVGTGQIDFTQSFSNAEASCSLDFNCEITPALSLTSGSYTWLVRAVNAAGVGPWGVVDP